MKPKKIPKEGLDLVEIKRWSKTQFIRNDFFGFFIYNHLSINGGCVHETNRIFNRGSCFAEWLRDER